MLYLVPTPVGNLEDMTFRAIEVLKSCDIILSEDTRTSGKLMKHFGIERPLWSFHTFNEHKTLPGIIEQLQFGKTLALVSDAGTPAISDPGFLLVRACVEKGIRVSCLPGPTAFVPALAASGLTTDKFFFEGFLPHKKGRQTRWQCLTSMESTIILYESPHRLVKCLSEIVEWMGPQRKVCVAREISKMHEEITTATVAEMLEKYRSTPPRGEIVVVIEGAAPTGKGSKKSLKRDEEEE
jgi:16S rRNA (cytidine1402-2'-O)-methyltransferase